MTSPDAPEQSAEEDNNVGYGHPPIHSRFQPGQSGNPKGRQKGAKNLKTVLSAAMNEKVTIRTNKGAKKVTKLEALVQKTANEALAGDPKAVQTLMGMLKTAGLDDELDKVKATVDQAILSSEDDAILKRYLPRQET